MGNQNFEKQVQDVVQQLDKQNLSIQTHIRENKRMQQKLLMATSAAEFQLLPSIDPSLNKIVIANGKLLSQKQLQNLKSNNYDVILNYTDRTLFARKNPGKKNKLEKCNCKNIGPHKLKLLRFMFEHPRVPICEETIDRVYGNTASMSPGTLAKAIGELRKAFWQAPYILTESDWGEYVSHTGSVYLLNSNYKSLVIRYQL